MYIQQIDELPEHMRQGIVSLAPVGLSSYAWPAPRAVEIIDELVDWIVLGGDLYELRENGDIIPMTENWHYEPSGNSSDSKRSLEIAREYLAKIKSWDRDRHVLVDIVAEKR